MIDGVRVVDPDGWRVDGKSWDDPISYREWRRRLGSCTVDVSRVTFAPIDDVMRELSSVVSHVFVPDPNLGPQGAGKPMECRTCGLGYVEDVHRV